MRMYLASFILLESFLIGTFSSIDLFSFIFFLESILIPMYLIIGFWVAKEEFTQRYKFFVYFTWVSINVSGYNFFVPRVWNDKYS